MYQETLTPAGGRKRDALSVLSLIIVIVLVEMLGSRFSSDISYLIGVVHLFVFLIFVLFCAFFYFKRLRGFCYTFYTDEQEFSYTEAHREIKETIPKGTFAVSSIIGDSGTGIVAISPEEMRALVPYGDDAVRSIVRLRRLTRLAKTTGSVLIYEHDGKKYGLLIHPSDELKALLNDTIRNARRSE